MRITFFAVIAFFCVCVCVCGTALGQADTTPSFFSFPAQIGVPRSSKITSNTIFVLGINVPVPISIVGGEYSIDDGPFTSTPATVGPYQGVAVRVMSGSDYRSRVNATITIGGVSRDFLVTTPELSGKQFFPLQTGYAWTTDDKVVTTVTAGPVINGVSTFALSGSSSGSISYFSSTELDGVRAHRGFSPAQAVPGCDTVPATLTYAPPLNLIPSFPSIGQKIPSSGDLAADFGKCGKSSFLYSGQASLLAFEQVTVPAGRFEALKLQLTTTVLNQSTTATLWFAPGVGQIKQQDSDGAVSTLLSTNVVRTLPDEMYFTEQSDVAPGTLVTSNAVTIAGITAPALVNITGGEYSINGGAYTSQLGMVTNGQNVQVRLLSNTQAFKRKSLQLMVGQMPATFEVITGIRAPGAPTAVSAAPGAGSITVFFVPPVYDGGAAITGYTATCASSNGGASGSHTGGFATSIRVNGLTDGKSYTCTVSAGNAQGASAESAPSNAATPVNMGPVLDLLLDD